MEDEHFLSGYCRVLDASRMVTVVTENGRLTESDCSYGSCPYEAECQIGRKIRELTEDHNE